jgi:hypothetical protein
MWWFGMPALLKGWFDRAWHQDYAYGLRGPNGEWMGYGDGFLAGKRALAVVTMGGPVWFYGERGIHGAVDELLFPLQHGTLFYAGAEVLPPVLVSGADRFTPEEGEEAAKELRGRLPKAVTRRTRRMSSSGRSRPAGPYLPQNGCRTSWRRRTVPRRLREGSEPWGFEMLRVFAGWSTWPDARPAGP